MRLPLREHLKASGKVSKIVVFARHVRSDNCEVVRPLCVGQTAQQRHHCRAVAALSVDGEGNCSIVHAGAQDRAPEVLAVRLRGMHDRHKLFVLDVFGGHSTRLPSTEVHAAAEYVAPAYLAGGVRLHRHDRQDGVGAEYARPSVAG